MRSILLNGASLCWLAACLTAAEPTAIWQEQVTAVENGAELPLPDFSYAGYAYGEKAIPDEFDLPVFRVIDFGAVPDDDVSDREAIQAAIDAAEEAGGGIVEFASGTFLVNEEPDLRIGIEINASDIVLRGQGAGEGGTHLFMRESLFPADPTRGWTIPAMFTFTPPGLDVNSRTILEPGDQPKVKVVGTVRAGRRELLVADAFGFAIGDVITLCTETTALVPEILGSREPRYNWKRIRERGIVVSEKLEIREIDGNRMVFASPVMSAVTEEVDWFVIRYPVLRNCGFEDIHFEGNFHEVFAHLENPDETIGYSAVDLQGCLNSWLRRCRVSNTHGSLLLRGSLSSSILMVIVDGNTGHGSVNISFGSRNLIGLIHDETGQFHGGGVSHLAMGSVIWRYATAHASGPDFHGTFPRFSLIDAMSSDSFDNHGANFKDLPNHLDGLVYWNFEVTDDPKEDFDFWDLLPDEPDRAYGPLTAIDPIIVGLHGSEITFASDSVGRLESIGQPVVPESLYEAQLTLRLGRRPQWIEEARTEWSELLDAYVSITREDPQEPHGRPEGTGSSR